MTKAFASQADLEEKKTTFAELADGVYCLTAEGDPNSGVVVGEDGVMIIDARATPVMAQELIEHIRTVTDKPIKHVVLTHYHAVRVLGASAYGADNVIASDATLEMITERGEHDYKSELQRFPRLFQAAELIPGLTWPTMVFHDRMILWMGKREVHIIHAGRGHTQGDTVVWLPRERVLFSGDLVEYGATPYCGDAHFADWPATLDRIAALDPKILVPGRGETLRNEREAAKAIGETRQFLIDLKSVVQAGADKGHDLKRIYQDALAQLGPKYGHWVIFEHCMPFNVSRCYDEVTGHERPQIWTDARDMEMWRTLND